MIATAAAIASRPLLVVTISSHRDAVRPPGAMVSTCECRAPALGVVFSAQLGPPLPVALTLARSDESSKGCRGVSFAGTPPLCGPLSPETWWVLTSVFALRMRLALLFGVVHLARFLLVLQFRPLGRLVDLAGIDEVPGVLVIVL